MNKKLVTLNGGGEIVSEQLGYDSALFTPSSTPIGFYSVIVDEDIKGQSTTLAGSPMSQQGAKV